MKKSKSSIIKRLVVACSIFAVVLTGCSNESAVNSARYVPESVSSNAMVAVEDQVMMAAEAEDGNYEPMDDASARKIIGRISYYIETKDYTNSINVFKDALKSTGGIIYMSNENGEVAEGSAYSNFTLRVPTDKVEEFQEQVDTFGNIVGTSTETEDVTGEYFDTEARLTVLNAQEKRVLELLDKAETIEEMLQIESELSRIRTEIEQYTTTMKRLDSLTQYSTIELTFSQTKVYTQTDKGLWAQFVDICKESLQGFVHTLGVIGSGIMMMLPYVLIIGIVIILIVRAAKKKKANKNVAVSVENTEIDKE